MNLDEHRLKTEEYLTKALKHLELQVLQDKQPALEQYHYHYCHKQQHSGLKFQPIRIRFLVSKRSAEQYLALENQSV